MAIIQATSAAATSVHRLLARSRYYYSALGNEDLPTFLETHLGLVWEDRGSPLAFLGVEVEDRPKTLPAHAPNRAYVRVLAVVRKQLLAQATQELVSAANQHLCKRTVATLLIVHSNHDWMRTAFFYMDFVLAEQVQFFELATLQKFQAIAPHTPTGLQLRLPTTADLDPLAHLDATTFDPLWHLGLQDIEKLFATNRVIIAMSGETLSGYSALSIFGKQAHLARLAVHPAWQGRGIGRTLLFDAIDFAKTQRCTTLALNTQISNERSQLLYRNVGFRPTGQVTPVLTKLLANQ